MERKQLFAQGLTLFGVVLLIVNTIVMFLDKSSRALAIIDIICLVGIGAYLLSNWLSAER